MEQIRQAIWEDRFLDFAKSYLSNYSYNSSSDYSLTVNN